MKFKHQDQVHSLTNSGPTGEGGEQRSSFFVSLNLTAGGVQFPKINYSIMQSIILLVSVIIKPHPNGGTAVISFSERLKLSDDEKLIFLMRFERCQC